MSSVAHAVLCQYMNRRLAWLPGMVPEEQAVAYQEWRKEWLQACLEHITVSDQLQFDPHVLRAKNYVIAPPANTRL